MNIDELRAVQSRERSTSDLQELRDSFYADVADYLDELREERDRLAEERNDPYTDEVIRLTDEIRTAEQVTESIYERRVGKVVKRASFAANNLGDQPAGLTAEEQSLYADIVDCIEENKATVLDVVSNNSETPVITTDPTPEPEEPAASHQSDTESATSEMETTDSTDEPSPDTEKDHTETRAESTDGDTDRATIRITEDIGEIYGVDDRVYTLETDDIVRLPRENADPLLERDAAESLE